jgi:hypothetical protein
MRRGDPHNIIIMKGQKNGDYLMFEWGGLTLTIAFLRKVKNVDYLMFERSGVTLTISFLQNVNK